MIQLDSISVQRAVRYLPRTWDLLRRMQDAFVFNFTAVYGRNSLPNENIQFYKPMLWTVAGTQERMVTSVMEDYCPKYGLCKVYPFQTHFVCAQLYCNYGHDITGLYYDNPTPGCVHGEFILKQHIRFIEQMWDAYPGKRKFHMSSAYGGHMTRRHRYTVQQNDGLLADFLPGFIEQHPHTAVVLSADHGLHYDPKQKFNRFVEGSFEHRNPFLAIIPPRGTVDAAAVRRTMSANTQRFVTHRDMHKTLLGWMSPSTKQGGNIKAYDLTREHVPSGRSCQDAGIPDQWCNCFGRARPGDKRVDELEGLAYRDLCYIWELPADFACGEGQ